MIKNYVGLHAHYLLFLPDFSETWISVTEFWTALKYQISWKFVQWEPSSCGWAGRHDKAHRRFLQFCECAYKITEGPAVLKDQSESPPLRRKHLLPLKRQ